MALAAVAGRLLGLLVSSHLGEAARQRPVDGGGGVPPAGEAAQLADGVVVLSARQRRERVLPGLRGKGRRRRRSDGEHEQDGGAHNHGPAAHDPGRTPPGPAAGGRASPQDRGAYHRARPEPIRHRPPPPSLSRIARVVSVNSTSSSSSSTSYCSASMVSFSAVSAAMRSSSSWRCP